MGGREGGLKVKWGDIKRQRQDNRGTDARRREREVLQDCHCRAMKSASEKICISE